MCIALGLLLPAANFAAEPPMNILVLLADDWRYDTLGVAGNPVVQTPPTSGISNNDYAANFDDFLAAAPTNAPWCFWYGGIEPHRGYEFGSGVART